MKVFPKEKSKPGLHGDGVGGRQAAAHHHERAAPHAAGARRSASPSTSSDALQHIHSRGVAHRDMKPENIMVDDDDKIKLIDFGIASKVRRAPSHLRQVVAGDGHAGLHFARAGEGQARRRAQRSVFVGRDFVRNADRQGAVHGSQSVCHHERPGAEQSHPPRAVNSQITPELQEIIYRALEREPANRYKTADEFAWDLAASRAGGHRRARGELTNWKQRRDPWARRVAFYVAMALIPHRGSGAAAFSSRNTCSGPFPQAASPFYPQAWTDYLRREEPWANVAVRLRALTLRSNNSRVPPLLSSGIRR